MNYFNWRLLSFVPLSCIALLCLPVQAGADTVLAGFENNLNSPYVDELAAPLVWQITAGTSAFSTTTGATEGTSSLELTVPAGWDEALLLESEQTILDLTAGSVLAIDVNVPLGSDTDTDWISFQFKINSPSTGWTASPSLYDDHATGDGNVTLTWDYSALALNEADPWFELGLIVNPGEDRTLYIDNLRVLSDNAPGDYNGDGNVDAADYTVWRDGDSPDSTAAGYNLWVTNYDAAISVSQAVPEPSSIVLLGIASLVMRCTRRKKP